MDKRFRFVYGEMREDCTFSDGEEKGYINSPFQLVDLLNSYWNKCNIMEDKLEDLGFKVLFHYEDYDMVIKSFKNKFAENPKRNQDGEWLIFTKEEYEKIIKGKEENLK